MILGGWSLGARPARLRWFESLVGFFKEEKEHKSWIKAVGFRGFLGGFFFSRMVGFP